MRSTRVIRVPFRPRVLNERVLIKIRNKVVIGNYQQIYIAF
jgi:hypothetical protein